MECNILDNIIDNILDSSLDHLEKYNIIIDFLKNNDLSFNLQQFKNLIKQVSNILTLEVIYSDMLSTRLNAEHISDLLDYLIETYYGKEDTLREKAIRCFVDKINLENIYQITCIENNLVEEIVFKKITHIYNTINVFLFRKNMYQKVIKNCEHDYTKNMIAKKQLNNIVYDINLIINEIDILPNSDLKKILLSKFNELK